MAINPQAQAWAQQEANRLANRGYRGYLRNGHPGGANPYASGSTGTGCNSGGNGLIPTCEGSGTLVAAAYARSWDGRLYGVRSWTGGGGGGSGPVRNLLSPRTASSTGWRPGKLIKRIFNR